ncbi:MAG: AAA family ATPase [Gammaproteobacteria bacterium]|nr:AAA family ATPase [Gammaproteobacteria bacterium]
MDNSLKILIAGRDKSALSALQGSIVDPRFETEVRHVSNGHADPLHGVPDLPDLLVFHMDISNEEELACLVERPAELRPEILVIGPQGNTRLMRLAMKAGACDYLEHPVSPADFLEAVEGVWKNLRYHVADENGGLVTVVSAKGGSGSSFLAVNVAHIMAAELNYRVALLDLDMQFGTLGQYLDLKTQHGLLGALDMAEDLDAVALDAYMAKHSSGLSLLGPLHEELVLTRDIPLDRFRHLLDLTKASYNYTFVDQPRQIDDVSAAVYERADRVVLVVQQDLANIRDASRLRKILTSQLAVPEERVMVVVNRYDKTNPVELDDICKSLGIDKEKVLLVPNDYRDAAESVNMGIPMLEHARNSAVTTGLIKLANRISGRESTGKTGLFSKAVSTMMRGYRHGA